MITDNLTEFLQEMPLQGSLLALDIGQKRIGIAISQKESNIAFPKEVYERTNMRQDTGYLARICREEKIVGIVVGLPIDLKNQEGENCQKVRQFTAKLEAKILLPFLLQDERMTTAAVTRVMKDAGVKRIERHAQDDKLAACYLLQMVLDKRSQLL